MKVFCGDCLMEFLQKQSGKFEELKMINFAEYPEYKDKYNMTDYDKVINNSKKVYGSIEYDDIKKDHINDVITELNKVINCSDLNDVFKNQYNRVEKYENVQDIIETYIDYIGHKFGSYSWMSVLVHFYMVDISTSKYTGTNDPNFLKKLASDHRVNGG